MRDAFGLNFQSRFEPGYDPRYCKNYFSGHHPGWCNSSNPSPSRFADYAKKRAAAKKAREEAELRRGLAGGFKSSSDPLQTCV